MARRPPHRRRADGPRLAYEQIGQVVGEATNGLTVEQFVNQLQNPDAYDDPAVGAALVSLGILLLATVLPGQADDLLQALTDYAARGEAVTA